MLMHAARRVARGEFERFFARSRALRLLYGYARGKIQWGLGKSLSLLPDGTAADGFDPGIIAPCLEALHKTGFTAGLRLPQSSVDELIAFAGTATCVQRGTSAAFRMNQVNDGKLPDGTPVIVADIQSPQENGTVAALMADRVLLGVASGFLGYRPGRVVPRLWWSLPGDYSPTLRTQAGQEIYFHYDISGYHSLYLFFYLSETDRDSGAHVVVSNSHWGKSLRLLVTTAAKPDCVILERYGAEAVTIVEGPAGFGFFEDPACYHKALPPVARSRLMLQIRYS